MALLTWDDNLYVGVAGIDEQHKKWVSAFNDLVESIDEQRGTTTIADTLAFMRRYAAEHFAFEEAYMNRHGYPDAEAHQACHMDLMATLVKLESHQKSDALPESLDEVSTFLGNWLITHILDTDMKLGAWLKANGIKE